MKTLARRMAIGATTVLLAVGGVVGTTQVAQAATAGIAMYDVCPVEGDPLAYPTHGTTAVSWRCVLGPIGYAMDLDLYCMYKYNVNAYASYTNFNDPYSWRCNY